MQEAELALWLERKHSKAEILELYLNRVYFGSGAYGVEAAAERCLADPLLKGLDLRDRWRVTLYGASCAYRRGEHAAVPATTGASSATSPRGQPQTPLQPRRPGRRGRRAGSGRDFPTAARTGQSLR